MDAPPSAAVVRLAGDLGLRTCDATHAALLDAIAAHDEVVVDCTDADEIDASFLQLLLAARRTARTRGGRIRLSVPAAGVLLDALLRAGLISPDHPDAFWTGGAGNAR